MKAEYSGACWNQLMENESKESLAEMLMDSWPKETLSRIRLETGISKKLPETTRLGIFNRSHVDQKLPKKAE